MTAHYMELLFTPDVMQQQAAHGSRDSYARMTDGAEASPDTLGPKEAMFLATRDSFYIASTSASGWPYVQHRGGPPGFVKLLGDRQIGFADYRGNRQYVSLGNVVTDDRVALFFMDYVRRARLKMLGRMRAVALADDPSLRPASPTKPMARRSSVDSSSTSKRSIGTAPSTSRPGIHRAMSPK